MPVLDRADEGSTASRLTHQSGGEGSIPSVRSTLQVAPCGIDAARHAVLQWHYSRAMPIGKLCRLGVWEDDAFTGAVLFGRGANRNLARPYGLGQTECVELLRVALRAHAHPVSQIVAQALRVLAATSPGLRLVVSYADPAVGHHGGIYQAGNWLYLGDSPDNGVIVLGGQALHNRMLDEKRAHSPHPFEPELSRLDWARKYLDRNAQRRALAGKHRYVYPLDRAMRRQLRQHALPYPPAVRADG